MKLIEEMSILELGEVTVPKMIEILKEVKEQSKLRDIVSKNDQIDSIRTHLITLAEYFVRSMDLAFEKYCELKAVTEGPTHTKREYDASIEKHINDKIKFVSETLKTEGTLTQTSLKSVPANLIQK